MLPKTDPLLPLLGVGALLVASSTMTIAIALGGATLVALAAGHGVFVALRRFVPEATRFAVYLLVLATIVTATGLTMQAWLPHALGSSGVFLPLVAANAAILGRGGDATMREALIAALACTGALLLCGALREWLGNGALSASVAFTLLAVLLAVRNKVHA
jgi:Na+-translocating ferredoxin:NAD+ oxidoreductase subunit E